MTNSNNDTITLSNTLYDTTSIPAFDSSSLSTYITSSNILSGTAANDTITITGSAGGYGSFNNPMYTSTTNGSSYVHNGIGNTTWSNTAWSPSYGTPFVDSFPEWNSFKKLCDDYPGLEKSYENLKTVYSICYADSILPKEDK